MGKYTKQDIIRMVEEEDVEFIRLQRSEERRVGKECRL